jgi:hypothetical protein
LVKKKFYDFLFKNIFKNLIFKKINYLLIQKFKIKKIANIKMNSLPDKELKIGQNYKMSLNRKLGSGAFGEIYSGKKINKK